MNHSSRRAETLAAIVLITIGAVLVVVLPDRAGLRGLGPGALGGGVVILFSSSLRSDELRRRRVARVASRASAC
jgi:hypothetical protein